MFSCAAIHHGRRRVLSFFQVRGCFRSFLNKNDDTCGSTDCTDRYAAYRRTPPSYEIIKEVQEETRRTAQSIDQNQHQALYTEIEQAMDQHHRHTSSLPPELGPTGTYVYQWVTTESRESTFSVYQRYPTKENGQRQAAEVVLHMREVGHGCKIEDMSLSTDENLIAYVVQRESRQSHPELWVCNIERQLHKRIELRQHTNESNNSSVVQVEFGPTTTTSEAKTHSLFWTEACPQGRPYLVRGCSVKARTLEFSPIHSVFKSTDISVHVDLQRTKGQRFLVLSASSLDSNELYLISCFEAPILVKHREHSVLAYLEAGTEDNEIFLIAPIASSSGELAVWKTSLNKLPVESSSLDTRDPWQEACPGYVLFDVDVYRDFVVLYERSTRNGTERIRVVERRATKGDEWVVPLPEDLMAVSTVSPVGNLCWENSTVRFALDNPAQLRRIFEFDIVSRRLQEITAAMVEKDVEQQRVLISSHDGVLIPLSLVRQCIQTGYKEPTQRVLLMAYGSYGVPLDLSYSPALQPLLDCGVTLAFAHVRGGGELGNAWHEAGKKENKKRSVHDFVACAEAIKGYLVGPDARITARGFSAGGVVVAGALNQRPDLFESAILVNAFLDVEGSLKHGFHHLSQQDWEEFGNPLKEAGICMVQSICPTASMTAATADVRGGNKPKLLIVGIMDDNQVPFWHSLIYGKKLRASGGAKHVLLHFEASGGHQLLGTRSRVAALEAVHMLG